MDSHLRSIGKAVTWRMGGAVVALVIAFLLPRQVKTALAIRVADTLVKLGAFYVHERVWERIPFGRASVPDYQI